MAAIESDVLATCVEQLKASKDVPAAVAEELSIALAQEKLPKPEALSTLYSAASGDSLT